MESILPLIGLIILITRVVAANRNETEVRHVVKGGAVGSGGAAPKGARVIGLRAFLTLAGAPKTGEDGALKSLIAARRFRDASALIHPSDHQARITLALVRKAPIPDLLLAARGKRGARRTVARNLLIDRYPGERWGFTTLWTPRGRHGDPMARVFATLDRAADGLRWARMARIYRRLIRAYPNADDHAEWVLLLAMIEVLRGNHVKARKLTIDLANSDGPDSIREQASRISRALAAAEREHITVAASRPRAPKGPSKRVHAATQAQGTAWPAFPHDLLALRGLARIVVSDQELDPKAASEALAKDYEVWVGVLFRNGHMGCLPLVAVEPITGVVALGGGKVMDWSALARASLWGQRMIVIHPQGSLAPGKPRSALFTSMPCPTIHAGQIDSRPQALETLASAAASDRKDSLPAYLYARALLDAHVQGGNEAYNYEEHRTHLAVSAARFPGLAWPIAMLAAIEAYNGDHQVGSLLALSLREDLAHSGLCWLAKAKLAVGNVDTHLREALTCDVANSMALADGLDRAALRGDGPDVDAHLDFIQRSAPKHYRLPEMRQLREVTWRGAEGAIAAVPGAYGDESAALARLALAANTGRPSVLETNGSLLTEGLHRRDARDWVGVHALHSGDYDRILAATLEVARSDGLGPVLAHGIGVATHVLTSPGDQRVVEHATQLAISGDPHVASIAFFLGGERPALATQIARARVGTPGDPTDIAFSTIAFLLREAATVPAEQRIPLATEALLLMDSAASARDVIPLWDSYRAAILRHLDPVEALAVMRGQTRLANPLLAFMLVAAIASKQGDQELAQRMRARAANAALIDDGVRPALDCGLRSELQYAFATLDPALTPAAAWYWYSEGGDLPALPPIPRPGGRPVPIGAMWRLVSEGYTDIALAAHAQNWTPHGYLHFDDGAHRVAISAAISALRGNPVALTAALGESRHPAYLRAGVVAASAGIDVGMPLDELERLAPGLRRAES